MEAEPPNKHPQALPGHENYVKLPVLDWSVMRWGTNAIYERTGIPANRCLMESAGVPQKKLAFAQRKAFQTAVLLSPLIRVPLLACPAVLAFIVARWLSVN